MTSVRKERFTRRKHNLPFPTYAARWWVNPNTYENKQGLMPNHSALGPELIQTNSSVAFQVSISV